VGVDVKSVDGGKGALMSPRTPQGIQRQLIALLGGQHLKFAVFQGAEQLVDMPFYNDDEFSIIYNQEVAKAEEKPERKKINYLAKITGVTPKGLNLKEAPVETREFDNITAAKQWLLDEALTNLPTPVNNIEVFENGQSVWREWHWSHDALKSKNELWWDAFDPDRHKIAALQKERKRAVAAGEIPDSELSLHEQFEKANPRWYGPYFAWTPTSTVDAGTIWLSQYWLRASLGLKYKNKDLFFDND
jgi:hypothetical protein